MLATLAPLAMSRKGKKVRKPVRQALSMSWMAPSRAKPVGLVNPQPTSGAGAAFEGTRGAPSARLASATSVSSPTPTTMRP